MEIAQPITKPIAPAGRPTVALPWRHLLNLSIYWLGINVIWSGLGNVMYQSRLREMFGEAFAPGYVAILITVPVFISVLIQPTVAAISDYTISRWGRRKPYIFIGTLLDIVFLWALAEARVFEAMLVFVILLQCSSNFAQGPFQGYVPDLVPPQQVGVASGLMGVMIILGQMVGVGIAGLGLLQLGQSPFLPGTAEAARAAQEAFFVPTLALGAIELVTMLLLVATIDEGRAAPPRGGRTWLQIALGAWGTDILKERSYVWLLVSRLFYLMSPALLTGVGFFYLTQAFGFGNEQTANALLVIAAVFGGTTGLATFPAARLSDRVGRKRIIYASIAIGMLGMAGVALSPTFELTVLSLVPVGISAGAFLAVDWALMTDIIPKATTGRYMGISNVATAISGPLGLSIGAGTVTILVLLGLPPELRSLPIPPAELSMLYEAAPRIAMGLTIVFLAVSALALTRVDETRRED
ncbi:MAG: MFS transporter [Chloroflexota bacterium]|nr:MFS transporter [Chloroflexota bacterium]